jgi:hypothetical protein
MSICQPAGVDELTRIKLAKQQEKRQRFFPRWHLRLSDCFIRSGQRALGVSPGGPDGGAEAYRPCTYTKNVYNRSKGADIMQKTINIDNRLYEGLKQEAQTSGQTMTSIINQAIARHLEMLAFQTQVKNELQNNPGRLLDIVQKVVEALPIMDDKHKSTHGR